MTHKDSPAPVPLELPLARPHLESGVLFSILTQVSNARNAPMPETVSALALENTMYRVALMRLGMENKLLGEQLNATRYQFERLLTELKGFYDKRTDLHSQGALGPVLPFEAAMVDAVIQRYEAGLISLGRAAEIAGLPYDSMIEEIQKRGQRLRFGPSSVREAEADEERLLVSFKKFGSST